MKKILTTLALTTALVAPGVAMARNITMTGVLKNFGGSSAYLAAYVTDANGQFVGTVWVAGGRSKYYKHLSHWFRATGGRTGNAMTGASIGNGRSFQVSFSIADNMMDAGYELRIDAASENMREAPADIVIPLTSSNIGAANAGRRFIRSVFLQ